MTKFPKPLHENVIILQDGLKKEESKGGFEIPSELQEKPKTGIIMAASEGYYAKDTGVFVNLDVKKGDKVLYSPFAGAKIIFDGVDYLLLKQSDIQLILNN